MWVSGGVVLPSLNACSLGLGHRHRIRCSRRVAAAGSSALVAKLSLAVRTLRKAGPLFARGNDEKKQPPATRAQAAFKESIDWRNPLRGALQPTEKEAADFKAIGGLRNTSESLSRLSFVSAYGAALGVKLKKKLEDNPAWIDMTCDAIGTNDEEQLKKGEQPIRPPKEAIAEIRRIIVEHTADSTPKVETARRTDVDAHLL